MTRSEHPRDAFVIGHRQAVVTAVVIALIVGAASAVAAGAATRLTRTEIELAAARAAVEPSPRATPGGSGSTGATPRPSAGTDPEAVVTARLLETCITPLQQLAKTQETRLADADRIVSVYGSTAWDTARDNSINRYQDAYDAMRRAADKLRSDLIKAVGGTEVPTGRPASYGSAVSTAGRAADARQTMNNREEPARAALKALGAAAALPKVAEIAVGCPISGLGGAPTASPVPSPSR